jgi:hypothetical protein
MKRIISSLFAAAIVAAFGTNASAQLSASVGYLSSKTSFEVSPVKMKANLGGVYAGFTYNIPLTDNGLGVAPGVYFSYAMKDKANLAVVKGDLSESYFTVPIDFNYVIPVADGIKAIIFAGPSFSLGVTSDVKVNSVTKVGEIAGIKVNEGSENDMYDGVISQYIGYDRFDVMLGAGFGFDFEDIIRLTIGFDQGLVNRGGNAVKVFRNQAHIGLAYLF